MPGTRQPKGEQRHHLGLDREAEGRGAAAQGHEVDGRGRGADGLRTSCPTCTRSRRRPPADTVTASDPPAGTKVAEGSKVRINVSKGPTPVTVPNVVGEPINDGDLDAQRRRLQGEPDVRRLRLSPRTRSSTSRRGRTRRRRRRARPIDAHRLERAEDVDGARRARRSTSARPTSAAPEPGLPGEVLVHDGHRPELRIRSSSTRPRRAARRRSRGRR